MYKSQYPTGMAQFPSGWSQSNFGGGGGGGGNVCRGFIGENVGAGVGYGMGGGGFGMGGSGGCFGGFPGWNPFPWPWGFPSLPGGYIPVPWPYFPFQGGFGWFPSFGGGFGGANVGVTRSVTPQSPFGNNVYRPNMDKLDLGISPYRAENPQPVGRVTERGGCMGRGKGKGVVGESSQAAGKPKRTVYTPKESTALAKSWVSVVEGPVMLNSSTRDGLWNRICKSYEIIKPQGAKYHSPEELRKKWDRIKTSVSRFCDIYENNTRLMTNGRTMDDVKEMSLRQYVQNGRFPLFKYWDAFLVLKDSPKFQEGRVAGISKRMRLDVSGNYKSSGGSVDLNDDVDVEPSTVPCHRRQMGQKTPMRMSRGASSGSVEVQSGIATSDLAQCIKWQAQKYQFDIIVSWAKATDPKVKKELFIIMNMMKRNMGLPVDDDVEGVGDDGEGLGRVSRMAC